MKNYLEMRAEPTHQITLYLSGPIHVAEQLLREECSSGLCVTIEPTKFIYTGGEETGYKVGLLNYPRFPTTESELEERSRKILEMLLLRTFQKSGLLVSKHHTYWYTRAESEGVTPTNWEDFFIDPDSIKTSIYEPR